MRHVRWHIRDDVGDNVVIDNTGSLGVWLTRPSAEAPRAVAIAASGTLAMPHIFTRDP